MKLALRWIPAEVWVDVFIFPWITRKQLGEIAHRFRNRKFVDILQYCLHERGKQTLNTVLLGKITLSEIPHIPLPENIKFFKLLIIKHFDSRAVDFLGRISTLFTGVNLDLRLHHTWTDALRTVLDHLAPLIHGIQSLTFHQAAIPLLEQHFAQKLAQTKMISIIDVWRPHPQAAIDFALNWLTSEKPDHSDEPRLLEILIGSENFQQIFMAVQQHFLSANRPCTFAINLAVPSWDRIPIHTADFHMENNIGEQLHGRRLTAVRHFRINRHQPNASKALQEWVETVWESGKSNVVKLAEELTIGPLDANVSANEVDNGGEEEADGPSTSKKPKLTQ